MDFFKNTTPLSNLNKYAICENLAFKKDKLKGNIFSKKSERSNSSDFINDSTNKENILNHSPNDQRNISLSNDSNSESSFERLPNNGLPYTVKNINEINLNKYLENAKFTKKMTNDNIKRGEDDKNRNKENIGRIISVNKDENGSFKKKDNIFNKKKNRTIDYTENSLLSDLFSDSNSENKNVMVSELDIQLTNDDLNQEYNSNTVNENNVYKIKNNEDNFKKEIELNIKQFLKQNLEEKKRKLKNNHIENKGNLTDRNFIRIKKKNESNKVSKHDFKKNATHNLSLKQKVNAMKKVSNTITFNKSAVNYNEINKKKTTLNELKNKIGFHNQSKIDDYRRSFIYHNKNNKVAFTNMNKNMKYYNTINASNTNYSNKFYNSSMNTFHKTINNSKRLIQKNSNKSKENNKKPNTRLNITRSNFYNSILANKSGHKIYENMINTNLEPKIYYKNKNYFTEPKNFSVLKDNVLKQKIKVKQLNIMNESLVNRKLFNKDSKKTIKNPVCYTKKMSKLKNCDNEKKNDPVNEDDNQFIYYKKIITVNKK